MSLSMQPPPGGDTDAGPSILIITWLFTGISTVVVGLKIWTRLNIIRQFGADDVLTILALVYRPSREATSGQEWLMIRPCSSSSSPLPPSSPSVCTKVSGGTTSTWPQKPASVQPSLPSSPTHWFSWPPLGPTYPSPSPWTGSSSLNRGREPFSMAYPSYNACSH